MKHNRLVLLYLVLLFGTSFADESQCKLQVDENRLFDLTQLQAIANKKDQDFSANIGTKYKIFWDYCAPVKTPCVVKTETSVSIVNYYPSENVIQCIGVAADLDLNITMQPIDPLNLFAGVRLTYRGSKLGTCPSKPSVVIDHYCDETEEFKVLEASGYPDKCQQYIKASTIYGCLQTKVNPSSSNSGISGGSIFLIIFFTTAVIYLAVGSIYNYKWKDERGMHVLPNYAFWAGFGGLVKDGCKYTLSLLRIRQSSAYQTL